MRTYTKPKLELLVNDFAACVRFYTSLAELLDMDLVEAANNFRYWRNDHMDLAIRLRARARAWSRRRPVAVPHQVIFFTEFPQVVDDGYARATALNAPVAVTPVQSLRALRRYAVVFADPDGMRIELRYEPRPNWDDVPTDLQSLARLSPPSETR
jgi:catechol 2,3-dioxygenase-like lactoylglutathione lyase family enzyme